VFGFLLAALGVQLALNGLSDLDVIHLATQSLTTPARRSGSADLRRSCSIPGCPAR